MTIKKNNILYRERRTELVKKVNEAYPDHKGSIVLWGAFEKERSVFRQESSVYYYTGITEPGVVIVIDSAGFTTAYVPQYHNRSQWMAGGLTPTSSLHEMQLDAIKYLGDVTRNYSFSPLFSAPEYNDLLDLLRFMIEQNDTIFTLYPKSATALIEQKLVIGRLETILPRLTQHIQDISEIVGRMRRKKSKLEIEAIFNAISLTISAHEVAAHTLKPEVNESDIEAGINFIFTQGQGKPAFPSIVASGKNGTILHYNENNSAIKKNDLVVVDIGAEVNYYCADLTRTYPASGFFSARQRELYSIVLDAYELVAAQAKPGMWLNNPQEPEKSLQHIARNFFASKGLADYFIHGIGHFLGLDVHDVGNSMEPLQEGDVITIEPGIYIPEEKIGIRVEDNFWIIKDGAICLSENLPRHPDEIEALVQKKSEEQVAEETSQVEPEESFSADDEFDEFND